ncbi:MAG: hypothetical protein RL328_2538 [Acidobacteriota bacterium]|jgi:uncharacterized RDD family membrane protein YckC
MTMNCPYCRTVNDSAESRCVRCGRRLHGAGRPVTESVGSTALAVQEQEMPAPASFAMGTAEVGEDSGPQPSLFRDAGPSPKVVPIPTLSPLRSASPLERETVRRNAARVARSTRTPGMQQNLELQEQQPETGKRRDDALYCDARVALPTHRAVAAAMDCAVVVLASLLFAAGAYYADVNLALPKNAWLVPAGIVAVVTILYRGLWCLANSDTPGMKFAGLQLVDFDGRRPHLRGRVIRQVAGVLSLAAAGVGLLWALVDEESLTWHDHISKTFPTAK